VVIKNLDELRKKLFLLGLINNPPSLKILLIIINIS